jgi:hypothetical protein
MGAPLTTLDARNAGMLRMLLGLPGQDAEGQAPIHDVPAAVARPR